MNPLTKYFYKRILGSGCFLEYSQPNKKWYWGWGGLHCNIYTNELQNFLDEWGIR